MAIVKKYPAEILAIDHSIDGVYTLTMQSLGKTFKYHAGQFLHLAIDEYDPSGQWPDSRCFSMQTPPGQNTLKITYAVKGSFTARMRSELKLGSEVTLKLPYGDLFTRPHNKEHAVFVAGGTGITPFLSLFNDPAFADYLNPVLYAGFRSQEANLYGKELALARDINPGLQTQIMYDDKEGLLNIADIMQNSHQDASYFISGPPKMIHSFREYLIVNNVPGDRVITDDWE